MESLPLHFDSIHRGRSVTPYHQRDDCARCRTGNESSCYRKKIIPRSTSDVHAQIQRS